jgi:DNA polymerase-3 subunit gamma/tau
VIALRSLAEAAALAGEKRDIRLKTALERQVRPIRFDPTGTIEVALTKDAPTDLAGELGRKLTDWTGQRWLVVVSRETGGETLAETRATTQTRLMDDARADPLVAAVLARFPGAQVVDVRVTVTEDADPGLASGPTETTIPFDHTAPPDEDED